MISSPYNFSALRQHCKRRASANLISALLSLIWQSNVDAPALKMVGWKNVSQNHEREYICRILYLICSESRKKVSYCERNSTNITWYNWIDTNLDDVHASISDQALWNPDIFEKILSCDNVQIMLGIDNRHAIWIKIREILTTTTTFSLEFISFCFCSTISLKFHFCSDSESSGQSSLSKPE